MTRALLFFVVAQLVAGCAHYEYDLVKPEDRARHISDKSDEVFSLEPLEYRLRTADNRLVVRIYNPTSDPIELIGSQSVVVDPSGQSRPLRSQTIAPSSFIKLILPPLRPTVQSVGPTWGVGFGMSTGGVDHGGTYDDAPRYYSVYDEGNESYWDWNGQTDVRVSLVFQGTGDKSFRHEFVFHRREM